jgi:hypothetical protein
MRRIIGHYTAWQLGHYLCAKVGYDPAHEFEHSHFANFGRRLGPEVGNYPSVNGGQYRDVETHLSPATPLPAD